METRTWSTSYRGPLAIYAGATFAPEQQRTAFYTREINMALQRSGYTTLGELPCGMILATCELAQVLKTERVLAKPSRYLQGDEAAFGDFGPGRYAWILTNMQLLQAPIPAQGARGFWTCDLQLG